MGDRSNVIFIDQDISGVQAGVGVYTHNCGSSLKHRVAVAINYARPRFGDDSYFMRMVISNLLNKSPEGIDSELGWGIYSYNSTNGVLFEEEYSTIFVNCMIKTIRIGKMNYTFEDFINQFTSE